MSKRKNVQETRRISKRKKFGEKNYSDTSVDDELNDDVSTGEFHSTQELRSENDQDDDDDYDENHSDKNEDDDDHSHVDYADDEY